MIGEAVELVRLFRNLRLPPERLRRLQEQRLRSLCRHAWDNVPYYRRLFESAGVHPGDIRTVEDLRRLPITTKHDLRAAGVQEVTDRRVEPAACVSRSTSGSTGEPFAVHFTPAEARTRSLVQFRSLLTVGFRPWDRLVIFGPFLPHADRLHKRLGLYRGENLSPLLPVEEQIRRLRTARPTILWVYPTTLRVVLNRIDDRLSSLVRPRLLITSAERLDPVLGEQLQSDLGAEMFNFYGSIESGRIAWECRAHLGLHVVMDHVILEILDGAGMPVAPGEEGEVVMTSLSAFAMPFIRYRLGDVCRFLENACWCGISFPLIAPPLGLGREDTMIQLPSGGVRSPLAFHMIVRGTVADVPRIRLIQERADHLIVQLVIGKDAPPDFSELRRRFLEYLGEEVQLDIQVVDAVDADSSSSRPFLSKLS